MVPESMRPTTQPSVSRGYLSCLLKLVVTSTNTNRKALILAPRKPLRQTEKILTRLTVCLGILTQMARKTRLRCVIGTYTWLRWWPRCLRLRVSGICRLLYVTANRVSVGYDTAVIGGTMALSSFIRDFGWADVSKSTRDTIQANIVSTFQAGCFFGALLTFPIAEKIGRKRTVMIAGFVFLLGAVLQTAAQGNLNLIYAGRAIAGLGIGGSFLTVPVYIAEVAPSSFVVDLLGFSRSLRKVAACWVSAGLHMHNGAITCTNP
jgi:hypothetical protein